MTAAEWGTVIPAVVAVLTALAAFLRARASDAKSDSASRLSVATSRELTAHTQAPHVIVPPKGS